MKRRDFFKVAAAVAAAGTTITVGTEPEALETPTYHDYNDPIFIDAFRDKAEAIEPTTKLATIYDAEQMKGVCKVLATGEKILVCGLDEQGELKLVRDYM